MDWRDLYIKDFGTSQIKDPKQLELCQKKMKSFYELMLVPLYKPLRIRSDFKFSVPADKLTIRIMYNDLKKYYGLTSDEQAIDKIIDIDPSFKAKGQALKAYLEQQKEENKENKSR